MFPFIRPRDPTEPKPASSTRAEMSLRQLDEIVDCPDSMRTFLDQNPSISVNEIFDVTPHAVAGMEWTSNMLQRACSKHLTESVKWLLENGADPNSFRDDVEDINSIPPITLCVLHALTAESRAKAITNIRMLVTHGAYVNFETECSSYPLECAASIVTPRSSRDTWDISITLVELGAHTRHLAPNMFSAPPDALVKELKRIETERKVAIQGALTFALQCTEISRAKSITHHTPTQSLSSRQTTSPFITPRSNTRSSAPHTPLGSMCKSPFSSLSQGPLSQMGLVPSTPPSHNAQTHSPFPPSTPTPPRSRAPCYVYSTPKGPKNLSRKRSFAQIPWAPLLQHKAKRRRHERVQAPVPCETIEFATPKRKREQYRYSETLTPTVPNRKKQCALHQVSSVQVPADVQRIILDFALPISFGPYRKSRINTLIQMKTKRDCGQPLSHWLQSKIV